jgi:hypothetical protein
LYVVRHSLTMRQRRDDHRFEEQMAIEVRVDRAQESELTLAMTADLNPAGVGFRSTQRIDTGTPVTIELPLGAKHVTAKGEVRHVELEHSHLGDVYMHGVVFGDLPVESRDAIELYCTHHSMAVWRMRHRQSIDIVRLAGEMVHDLRGTRRHLVGLPAAIRMSGGEGDQPAELSHVLVLEELDRDGARFIGDVPIAPGTEVHFEVPGSTLSGIGVVRHVQTLETSVAVLFSIGVELNGARKRGRSRLQMLRSPLLLARGDTDAPRAQAS